MFTTPTTYTSYNYPLNSQNTRRKQAGDSFQKVAQKAAGQARQFNSFYQDLAPNATDQVKEAWKKAEQEAGTNGFAIEPDGMLTQITELMALALEKELQTGSSDILGATNSSARQAVQKALECLNRNGIKSNEELKEKVFYESFLKYLP